MKPTRSIHLIGCILGLAPTLAAPVLDAAPTASVDPFIGTGPNPLIKIGWAWDTGNVFPGAVCPRGMIAWSPDTTHAERISGGYWYPDDLIEDFSLTHFSGRGVPCLKDVGFLPVVGPIDTSPGTHWSDYALRFQHRNEAAAPGWYRVTSESGIDAELAVTPRTGLARFGYPGGSSVSLLLRVNGWAQVKDNEVFGYAAAQIPKTKHPYQVFFLVQFAQPIQSVRSWSGDAVGSASATAGPVSGLILSFGRPTASGLMTRVGISYTSIEDARDNLAQENLGWNLAAVRKAADDLWNDTLGRIQVDGGTVEQRTIFYTALYHSFMHPNLLDDANGRYLGMDGQVHTIAAGHHQYQNIPAWDQHRSHTALMAIVAGNESSDVMQSLVNNAAQDAKARPNGGGLPRWEQVNHNSGGMVGDGADSMIATAYAYGARQFDVSAALAAMIRGASRPGTTSDGVLVRAGLPEYLAQGYVANEASVTLEYCTDDFSVSRLAENLGDAAEARAYLSRAQNWKNLFDPTTTYIRPRAADGEWDPKFSPGEGHGFIEGTAAQYFWMVNFNLRGLIDRMGGNALAVSRLDRFFTQLNAGLRTDCSYMGNEPCEETPWVYDFAGAPWRAQAVVRRIELELFRADPDGLPGNDDAGAMSSWYVFSALGLYPDIPGVGGFVVGSPMFPRVRIRLDSGSDIEIRSENSAPDHPYVRSLRVNGQTWNSPWIPWAILANGGKLDFELNSNPSQWGMAAQDAPPSFDPEVR
jgi:predicted alpha-1,2-mannosidase